MRLHQTRYEVDDRAVGHVTFDRAERHNVMNPAFMADLSAVMEHAATAGVRALVLTGAGASFCAGADLEWMGDQLDRTRQERIAASGTLGDLLHRLDTAPLLTIAAVNGPAYGGGVGIIAACDIAIAGPGVQLALTEVTLGLAPSNIAPYVVRRMGPAGARRALLNATVMDGPQARRLGLIDEVVDDLDAAVEAEVGNLLRCGPQAVAATKRLIAYVDTHDHDANRTYAAADLADAWERAEGREGITAFLEKRRPAWRPPGGH